MDYEIDSPEKSVTGTFRALADARRRRLLAVVDERSPAGISLSEAASRLADATTSDSGADDRNREIVTSLSHVHVPLLVEEGLIEYDRDADVLATTDHPAYDDPGVRDVLECDSRSTETLDELFDALASERRIVTLGILADQDRSMDVETVAHEVAMHETGGQATDAAVEDVLVDLVHSHRPRLEAAGLIDADEDGLSFEGHPELRDEWLIIVSQSRADGDLEEGDGSVLTQPI